MTDYGYEDSADDYGYGDTADTGDYGYGDEAAPAGDDYGYGDTPTDYDYGDTPPAEDLGYGDAAPEEAAPKRRTPKRRCSVTKYSLVSAAENGGAEAEMVKNLNAAEMLNQFRNGGGVPPVTPSDVSSGSKSDETAVETVETTVPMDEVSELNCDKKVSKFSRFRKRLSIFG